jgi:RES domain/HEPN/RES N-terminal domain 1
MSYKSIEELKEEALCHHCVGEAYLSQEMVNHGEQRKCSYCGIEAETYLIGELFELIETAFEQYYIRTSDEPTYFQRSLLSDRESNYNWERDGEPVVYAIMNAADMPQLAAEDIQRILKERYSDHDAAEMGEETEFSSDSYYEEKGTSDASWQEEWDAFERSLKTEARFFSQTAAAHLASVFDGIDALQTRNQRPLVVDAGPETPYNAFYRARAFQADDKLEAALCRPDQSIGPPPSLLAAAGRMNARGISVFYGSNEAEVAVAEVRPPVGSQVAVARFEIVRPLRLLDLTAASETSVSGSVFDIHFGRRLERAMFLGTLSRRMTRPVMPDDEAFEYLATQAVADFLATWEQCPLDGILFPSVQAAGDALNVVLFHKAARVEAMGVPDGMNISANTGLMTDDGWEVSYTVYEEIPPEPPDPKVSVADNDAWAHLDAFVTVPLGSAGYERRVAALRIDPHSVEVRIVRRIQFEIEDHQVQRHRWTKDAHVKF